MTWVLAVVFTWLRSNVLLRIQNDSFLSSRIQEYLSVLPMHPVIPANTYLRSLDDALIDVWRCYGGMWFVHVQYTTCKRNDLLGRRRNRAPGHQEYFPIALGSEFEHTLNIMMNEKSQYLRSLCTAIVRFQLDTPRDPQDARITGAASTLH